MDFSLTTVLKDALAYWDTVDNRPSWAKNRNTTWSTFSVLDDITCSPEGEDDCVAGTTISASVRLCPAIRLGGTVIICSANGPKTYARFGSDSQLQITNSIPLIDKISEVVNIKHLRTVEIHLEYICQKKGEELEPKLMTENTNYISTPCPLS